jgi:hypothetical protein
MGISCIVDSNGRVLSLPGPTWAESKGKTDPEACPPALKEGVVVSGVIPIDSRQSLYVFWGDILPQVCWLIWGGALVVAFVRRKKHCKLQIAN